MTRLPGRSGCCHRVPYRSSRVTAGWSACTCRSHSPDPSCRSCRGSLDLQRLPRRDSGPCSPVCGTGRRPTFHTPGRPGWGQRSLSPRGRSWPAAPTTHERGSILVVSMTSYSPPQCASIVASASRAAACGATPGLRRIIPPSSVRLIGSAWATQVLVAHPMTPEAARTPAARSDYPGHAATLPVGAAAVTLPAPPAWPFWLRPSGHPRRPVDRRQRRADPLGAEAPPPRGVAHATPPRSVRLPLHQLCVTRAAAAIPSKRSEALTAAAHASADDA